MEAAVHARWMVIFGRLILRRKSKQARATLVQIKLNIETVKGKSRHRRTANTDGPHANH